MKTVGQIAKEHPHTRRVLEHFLRIPLDIPAQEGIARLRRLKERELSKRAAGHWSYDVNRLIAIAQHLNTLEELCPTNSL